MEVSITARGPGASQEDEEAMREIKRGPMITIGAVAEALGIAPSTVRLWEEEGIIPPATRVHGGGNCDRSLRVYTETELEALRLIAESRRRQRRETASSAVRERTAGAAVK